MSPLDEFANSPRRLRNDDGSEVASSSLVKLGPGIVASRPAGAPGEATFATLDAPGIAALQTQIDALTARVAALEAVVVIENNETKIKNPQGQTLFRAASFFGVPRMSFFDQTPQPRVVLDPSEATATLAQNTAFELNAKGFTSAS